MMEEQQFAVDGDRELFDVPAAPQIGHGLDHDAAAVHQLHQQQLGVRTAAQAVSRSVAFSFSLQAATTFCWAASTSSAVSVRSGGAVMQAGDVRFLVRRDLLAPVLALEGD